MKSTKEQRNRFLALLREDENDIQCVRCNYPRLADLVNAVAGWVIFFGGWGLFFCFLSMI